MSEGEKTNVRMNCRVAAVILHEGCILLQGEPEDTFWTLPGGSVELFESSEKAMKRELQETLEVDVRIERLLWVTEEFFMAGDKPHHQLGFYYLVTALADWYFFGLGTTLHRPDESGTCETIFRWFVLDDLDEIDLYPTFLHSALLALPATTEHIVLVDEDMPVLSTVPMFPSDTLLN